MFGGCWRIRQEPSGVALLTPKGMRTPPLDFRYFILRCQSFQRFCGITSHRHSPTLPRWTKLALSWASGQLVVVISSVDGAAGGDPGSPLAAAALPTAVLAPSRGLGRRRVRRLVRVGSRVGLDWADRWFRLPCFLIVHPHWTKSPLSVRKADQCGPTATVVSARLDGDMLAPVHSPTSQKSHDQLRLWQRHGLCVVFIRATQAKHVDVEGASKPISRPGLSVRSRSLPLFFNASLDGRLTPCKAAHRLLGQFPSLCLHE